MPTIQANTVTPLGKMAWNFVQAGADLTEVLIYDVIADKQSYNWWTDERGTEVTPRLFKKELDEITTSNICVRINSGGGDVFAAEAIRTAIMENRQSGKKITCKIDGLCASAAVGIAAACESTAISASSYFMIHDPASFAYGYYDIAGFEKYVNMLRAVKQGIINAYAKKTGKDKEEISALMNTETWYTGDEAVEAGFCDELMFEESEPAPAQKSEAMDFTPLVVNMYRNIPAALLNRLPPRTDGGFSYTQTNDQTPIKESTNMEQTIKTVDELCAAYPDLTAQIAANATNAERKRIQDIEGVALGGFERIVADAKFKNPIDAGTLAVQIVNEQKKQGATYAQNVEADVKDSGVQGVGAAPREGVSDSGDGEVMAAIDRVLPKA